MLRLRYHLPRTVFSTIMATKNVPLNLSEPNPSGKDGYRRASAVRLMGLQRSTEDWELSEGTRNRYCARPRAPCCGGRMTIIETFERGCNTAISPDRSNPDRQIMIAIARSRRPNADHSCRLCSIGCELIRPKTRAVHQITSPMAIATGSTHRHAPLLQSHLAASHQPSRHARISSLPVALKSP